ncbi:MAG: hypothetical protein ACJ71W_15845 [Terriglobales bacterium]
MKDKDLIEVFTFLLNTQRQQQEEIARLMHIVTLLRAATDDEHEKKIDEFLRARIPQARADQPSADELTQAIDEKLRELDQWAGAEET